MRGTGLLAFAALALLCVSAAHADVRSYCAAFARDEADRALNGSAILNPKTAKPLSAEDWKVRNQNALADCLALYGEATATETPAAAKPETVKPAAAKPASKTKVATAKTTTTKPTGASATALVPGSDAWKDFCAAKYVSFNRDTGTYKSRTGKQRPCVAVK
jgi:hypothetical protein